MQPTDKFRTDLDQAVKRAGGAGAQGDRVNLEAIRGFFYRYFPSVTDDAKAALFTTFLAGWKRSPERATTWLSGVGSILLMDYDGTAFSEEEWRDIRDSVALAQGELDLDLLGYVMSLVLEHGAL